VLSWEDSGVHFRFEAAAELIRALPRRSPERTAVFSQALDAYSRRGDDQSVSTGPTGMAGLVMLFANELPPEIVLDAIVKILRNAKEQAEQPSKNSHITFAGHAGTASLSSSYQCRLFQILFALRELDPPKARGCCATTPTCRICSNGFPMEFGRCSRNVVQRMDRNQRTRKMLVFTERRFRWVTAIQHPYLLE